MVISLPIEGQYQLDPLANISCVNSRYLSRQYQEISDKFEQELTRQTRRLPLNLLKLYSFSEPFQTEITTAFLWLSLFNALAVRVARPLEAGQSEIDS